MASKVLAYDLGGTKVAVAIVDSHGKILRSTRKLAIFDQGKRAVIEQLVDLGKEFLAEHPDAKHIGMASAGPLDPGRGLLLDPHNFARGGKHWGVVPISKILTQRLKRKVFLDNDAAAAILAEKWAGAAKKYDNAMILTLGTGLGTGIICNGSLVRAGRGLHPEGGHIPLQYKDMSAPCGCGNHGCAEAFLSGNGFGRRAAARLRNPKLSAKDVADLARKGDKRAKEMFREYAELLAVAVRAYAAIYAPEIVVLTGSFSHASDLFLDLARMNIQKSVESMMDGVNLVPKLTLSKLGNDAGVIGGAYLALQGAGILRAS